MSHGIKGYAAIHQVSLRDSALGRLVESHLMDLPGATLTAAAEASPGTCRTVL